MDAAVQEATLRPRAAGRARSAGAGNGSRAGTAGAHQPMTGVSDWAAGPGQGVSGSRHRIQHRAGWEVRWWGIAKTCSAASPAHPAPVAARWNWRSDRPWPASAQELPEPFRGGRQSAQLLIRRSLLSSNILGACWAGSPGSIESRSSRGSDEANARPRQTGPEAEVREFSSA